MHLHHIAPRFSFPACFTFVFPLLFLLLCNVVTAQVNSDETQQLSVTQLLGEAGNAYDQKDYELSLKRYAEALRRGEESETVAYNAACCAALTNRSDEAFEYLHQALAQGWTDSSHLKRDSDLETLHDDSRWSELIERVRLAANLNKKRWRSTAFQTPYADDVSRAEKAAGLSKLWAEVKFNFVNFHLVPDLDWDAEYMAMMPKVLETNSTLEYYRLLETMVAKLKDGHTNVYLPAPVNQKFNARPQFRTQLIEGKVIVAKILDPKVKELGIQIGQEVLQIDGIPVLEYAEKNIKPFMCASTPQDLDTSTFENFLLRGNLDEEVDLRLAQANGEFLNVRVERKSTSRIASYFSGPPAFEMEMLEGNIAHVKLNSFGSSKAASNFAAAFDEISKTDGLILDLRNNGGGNSGVGWSILAHLTDQPFKTTQWHTLQYRPTSRAWNRQPLSQHGSNSGSFAADEKSHFQKPVVMLIGPKTFSAAEDMAAAFDMLDRGKIIGTATGGSTGQPLMFPLPGGGQARVCTKHDSYADGTEFVGKGIQPDVKVSLTIEDFRNGTDRVLDTAVLELKKDD